MYDIINTSPKQVDYCTCFVWQQADTSQYSEFPCKTEQKPGTPFVERVTLYTYYALHAAVHTHFLKIKCSVGFVQLSKHKKLTLAAIEPE
jgi:hypothetical protein